MFKKVNYGALIETNDKAITTIEFALPVGGLPGSVDLRTGACNPYFEVWDQGDLNICTSMAWAGHYGCESRRDKTFLADPLSTRYNYWTARKATGQTDMSLDSGLTLSRAVITGSEGTALRDVWDWEGTSLTTDQKAAALLVPPPALAIANAVHQQARSVYRLGWQVDNMKKCLAHGHSFMVSFKVTAAMEDWFNDAVAVANSLYILPFGNISDRVTNGHAVLCVGYENDRGLFLMRNSWGQRWGMNGHFFMDYITMSSNLIHDLLLVMQPCSNCRNIQK